MRLALLFLALAASCWTGTPHEVVHTRTIVQHDAVICPWLDNLPTPPEECDMKDWGDECVDIDLSRWSTYGRDLRYWLDHVVVPSCGPDVVPKEQQ